VELKYPQGKIVAIGELLVELVPVQPDLKLNQEGTIIKTASGSSGIFACAMAKLCNRAAFIGKMGCDQLSDFLNQIMVREGVDTSHVAKSADTQIGLAFVENLSNGRNFEYYRKGFAGSSFGPDDVDEEFIVKASTIHYSGMLLELSGSMRAACQKCVKLARKAGVLVSFDPNIRKELIQDEGARERLLEGVRTADIIAPTLAEAKYITGLEDIREILKTLHQMGPEFVALTRDAEGAVVSDGKEIVFIDGMTVNAIDPTGAGDTFAAMLVYGVQQGWSLEKIAKYCNCAGSLAVTKQGTIGRALPSLEEVAAFVNQGQCKLKVEKYI